MNNVLKAACGLTVALAMSGCVYAGPPHQPAYVQGSATYDGYYDGYYGAYSGGYWHNDGYFYYRDSDNRYRRDDQRHFRREQFHGGSQFRADQRDRSHYDHNNRDYDNDRGRNRSGQGGSNRYQK
ncbi:MAG: hypothetical protein Q7T44_09800 [Parvibaculum sp.]|nr:hypothetical protein [Parvibaculum sp.]